VSTIVTTVSEGDIPTDVAVIAGDVTVTLVVVRVPVDVASTSVHVFVAGDNVVVVVTVSVGDVVTDVALVAGVVSPDVVGNPVDVV